MKLAQLQEVLRKKKINGCLLYANDPNFRYYLQDYLMSGAMFIPAKGKPTVFIHRLEELEHDFNVVRIESKFTIRDALRKTKVLGYNPSQVSAQTYSRLRHSYRLRDIGQDLEQLRMVKKPKEIEYLEKGVHIAQQILRNMVKNFDFKTEGEAKRFIKTEMARYGVEQAFEPIVASGKGAAVPHYFGDARLRNGFMIVDIGVKWKGYCSDITRTFYIGTPSSKDEKLYEKVLEVQKYCVKSAKTGASCGDLFDYAQSKLGEEFCHGLGHGIGLEIHELPNLKPGNQEKLQSNMVVTVEPGWYKGKTGIRIEDDVLVKKKPVLMTRMNKELVCF
ncbi:M24 family metallopeptidase [Nanoarchaeota archaeon]